jgi:aminoglycoside/choline kinase family phosphotransferase
MADVIPASPDELSDAWLESALCAAGVLHGAHVTAHRTELVEAQGAAAVVARLEIEYDRIEAGAPRSLVAKFASPYEPIRMLMRVVGGYAREVEFYRQFGADAGISTPRCYHADIDPASSVFVLLLEDMGDARVPDGLVASIEDVELAVRNLAPFHAKWWNHARLRELEFLRYPGGAADQAFMALARGALAAALPAAKVRFGAALPPALIALAEHLEANFDALMEARRQASRDSVTLVHGDFHPGQVFLPSERGGRFAVFDWQTVSAGIGGDDLARIIATGLTAEQQASCDLRLIDLYHKLLVEHGVTGYDAARCRDDFRQGLITSTVLNIIAGVNIDPALIEEFDASSNGAMTDVMFGRIAAAVEAHGVLDALRA